MSCADWALHTEWIARLREPRGNIYATVRLAYRWTEYGIFPSKSQAVGFWTRGVAWLTHLLVTQKIAGSNPVGSAAIDVI